jgi:hypothetical protein
MDNINVGDKVVIMKDQKEQYAIITDIINYLDSDTNNEFVLVRYDYGHFGFHSGSCLESHVRVLTSEERTSSDINHFWKLPQQFYQSL